MTKDQARGAWILAAAIAVLLITWGLSLLGVLHFE